MVVRAGTPFKVLGSLLVLSSLCIALYFFVREYPRMSALDGPSGRSAVGRITALGSESAGRYTGYYADVAFQDDAGSSHRFRAYYTYDQWMQMHADGSVKVRFTSNDPSNAVDPGSYMGRRNPLVMLLLTAALCAFGIVLLVVSRFAR